MRKINKIIVHCSATKEGQDIGLKEIRDYHVNTLRWGDVGYHFIIRLDGLIDNGRPIEKEGSHCLGHNQDSVGICLVGGLDAKGKPANTFTQKQFTVLNSLILELKAKYGNIPVYGHRDFNRKKACPCFEVKDYVI